jgi:hypothetical protein
LPKETNQRKGSRSLGQPSADYPALLDSVGSLKTRYVQTVQTPFSTDSLLLGCVKWQYLMIRWVDNGKCHGLKNIF